MLVRKLCQRNGKEIPKIKTKSTPDTTSDPVLGIPPSIENDLQEIVHELTDHVNSTPGQRTKEL